MDRIVGISDRSNAAIHALALAATNGGSISASAAAERLGVSPSYLAKVLQALAKAGIIASSRGAAGGFSLIGDPAALSCGSVLEALDGPLPRRACLFERAVCATGSCPFSELCVETVARLEALLRGTSVADLARPSPSLPAAASRP